MSPSVFANGLVSLALLGTALLAAGPAASESLNAKIQWVKYTARGFRNLRNFFHAVYFPCGGLDLAPATH